MYSTREEIKAAVDAYRAHIAERNRRAVEVYVQVATQAELDPKDWGDGAEDMRTDCFGSVLARNDARTLILSPEDILTKFDELAPLCDLDGCGWSIPTSDERELYFSRLERALKAKCREEVRDSITAPPELRILAEYVGSLTGPGMGETKWTYQAMFWTGAGPETDDSINATVKRPQELTVDGCWEVAAGWESGHGVESFFCIVYCRRKRLDGEVEPWAWRYMAHGPDDCKTFDTIPELLEWYCRYREREVPNIEDLDVDEVLEGHMY
ncbi:hypothetical protein CGCSCA4_v008204 [Colletotrichum siamense]|uniref:Uncharacterized protein n=1 Tax=Colletotrichum siamense TaxID=690259 RepID=A0A9P5ET30_COLSI|nr:hypothetical protein CGCSCA4_v008204 [Colletotrichum siamense]KAF4859096.1 hypothetical protein CGCSCA2_v006708 [Colletotrichum siamense]